ncbi:c-type cytochrome, partial [bacterium]|nr:c-type cytochrome [bacterium]
EKELRLPVGKPVRLALVSSDVNHSFYIPAYKIKEDLIPGRENYISFTPLRAGVYDIMCAEFCGTGHSTMLSRLIAMPAKEFDLWLAKPRAQQPIPIEQAIAGKVEQVERGSSVYDLNCQSCHGPEGRGTGVPRARNFTSLENWKNGPTIPEMFRTLYNGLGREMPSFQHLPMDDRFAAIHYIRTFNPNYPNAPEEAIHALDTEYNISRGQLPRPELPIAEAMLKIVQEAVGKRPFSGVEPSPATPIAKPSPVLGDEELARLKERDPLGADLYQANCASCHGGRGQGGRTVETLDEIWGARFRSLALTDPQGTWRKEDAEALRLRMEAISIATGGIKPEFNTFSQSDWQAVHDFILGLVPPVSLDLEMQ